MEEAGSFSDKMLKFVFKTGKVEKEILKKTESGEQERNADRSCFTTASIFTRANVRTSLGKEYEEYASEDVQLSTEKRTDCDFLLEDPSLSTHSSAFLQSFYCTRDVMFDPADCFSRQTFERVATEEWYATETRPCLLSETPLDSSCSSMKEWNDWKIIIDAESMFDEVEGVLVNPTQLMKLCEERRLHSEWAILKQDWAILVHVHGEKIHYILLAILLILAKDSDYEKSDFFIELSHQNLVKPFACCWEDKKQLQVCWIIQKENLRNHPFKKYPTIKPMSWKKLLKINTGAGGRLTSLHSLKKLEIYQNFKTTKSLEAQTASNMDARDFTALDIPSISVQCGKKNMEIEKTPPRAWALRTKDEVEKAFQWRHQQSHRQDTRTMNLVSFLIIQTTKSLVAQTPNNMDGRDFTALDIPSVLVQCGKKDMEIKKTPPSAWALRTKDLVETTFQWWHQKSYSQNTRTMRTKHESQSTSHHPLLLTSTFLAVITLHTALKLSRHRSEEGYKPKLNSMFQIEIYSNQLLIMLNSLAFFLSVALMMRIFSGLPFRPWLLISVFSMIGAYMCIMMDPVKPLMFTS